LKKFPPRLTKELIKEYEDRGLWRNKTIVHYLKEHAKRNPEKEAIVEENKRVTYAQLWKRVNALASGLRKLGVEEGDVVSYQLPNWVESAELHFAVILIGAINNPVNFIYQERELEYVLNDAKSKVFFIPNIFRGTNFPEMVLSISGNTSYLEHIVTVREKREGFSYSEDIITEHWGDEINMETDPNALSLLMYTSGTTSAPKGVEHSQNTLLAEVAYNVKLHMLSSEDKILMPAPVTHMTGVSAGTLWPIYLGGTVVYMDKWNVQKAVELIEKERITYTKGATPFLQQLVNFDQLAQYDISSLKLFGCGGASIYPNLIYEANKKGINAARGYGSTEHPTISNCTYAHSLDLRAENDGIIHEHNTVKIVDIEDPSKVLPIGAVGEICSKGPELFLGYHQPEMNIDAFDEEGYFLTGDIGRINPDNTLEIVDRKKDIIIRKGENISTKEIEDLIYEHQDVLEAAVVGLKDETRGERITAVVVLRNDAEMDLSRLIEFLESRKISKRKLPEQLEIFSELPKNNSGKIQKFKIKQLLQGV
jgi:cyclohexanecarboxylate-CoA ligase